MAGLEAPTQKEGRRVRVVLWAHKRFSTWNRSRKAERAIAFGKHFGAQSVLLVGVSADRGSGDPRVPSTNLIENKLIEAFPQVIASGLAAQGSGWPDYVQADALHLPFEDEEFDFVFSNAVIEHVGDAEAQAVFVHEHARVGRHWMFTTPNRLFPVESHTFTLFRHMSQKWRPPKPVYTRLLSKTDIRDLIPKGAVIRGIPVAPTFTVHSGWGSKSPRQSRRTSR
jgi:hypothetical protein